MGVLELNHWGNGLVLLEPLELLEVAVVELPAEL